MPSIDPAPRPVDTHPTIAAIERAALAELRGLHDGAITLREAGGALDGLLVALDALDVDDADPEWQRVGRWLEDVLARLAARVRLDAARAVVHPDRTPEAQATFEDDVRAIARVFGRLPPWRPRRGLVYSRPRSRAAARERRARRSAATGSSASRGDPPDDPPSRTARHLDGGDR